MATPWHFQGESKTVQRHHYWNAKPMPTIQTSISQGKTTTKNPHLTHSLSVLSLFLFSKPCFIFEIEISVI